MTTAPTRARESLSAWEASKPTNFFTSDTNLQRVLQYYLGASAYEDVRENLSEFGAATATVIDAAAKQEDLIGNHPRLQRYTGIGERVEAIEFHPNHHLTGDIIWKSGILEKLGEKGKNTHHLALFYLLSHNGEAGHCCAIACTAGLIRALQYAADDTVRDKFLPALIAPDYATMQQGAQFLTEVQGGSDVGKNAVRAVNAGDGTWRISGEKWFCSNINADQFLVMARPEGAKDGTGGLGAFIIPRKLDDGTTNGFYIRRLKEKLGTRTLASAELDFLDAVAYPIGNIDAGFKITVELVLNTSRLLNAVSCAGLMRRAYIEASTYACSREAFGNPIANYPLVQEATADILAENYAATASGFALANLLDQIDLAGDAASEADQAVYRLLVNVNKYITSIRATEAIHRAIEVLGGNGAIESFSILPRLYRDIIVLESWEGTHNVLCLQVLRDIARYELHIPFMDYMKEQLAKVNQPALLSLVEIVSAAQARTHHLITRLLQSDANYQQAHARRLTDQLAHLAQGTLLLVEANWELEQGYQTAKVDVAAYFINRRITPHYDPLDDAEYIARLGRLMSL